MAKTKQDKKVPIPDKQNYNTEPYDMFANRH